MQTVSIREAAQRLQVSHDVVYRLVTSGQLKFERITPKSPYRISEQSLQEYAEANSVKLLESMQQPEK